MVKSRAFKLLPALAVVCLAAGKLQADPSVDWVSDTYNSFDVILTGTGAGWSGTVTSPSGLWQLQSGNVIGSEAPGSSLAFVDNVGDATFLGQLPSQLPAPNPSATIPFNAASIGTYGGYMDYFNPGGPINDRNSLICGYLNDLSEYGSYQDWSGM